MGVAHLAFDFGLGHERGNGVDDDDVDAARTDQHVSDLKGLLTRVGLGDQEGVGVHAQGASVDRVEGVLGVDERGVTASLLGVSDGMQGDRGLTGGLGAVDLDHAAARQATDTEGNIEREGTRGDHLNRRAVVVAQAHDGTLTELLVDLRQGDFERLVAIVGRGLCGGCFTGCHGDPFVCGLSGLRVSWPGNVTPLRGDMTSMRPAIVICVPRAPPLWTTRVGASSPTSLNGTHVRRSIDTPTPQRADIDHTN